jgi:hypothetical protein
MNFFIRNAFIIVFLSVVSCNGTNKNNDITTLPIQKEIVLHPEEQFQTIDGFGVNITPAQWRDGNPKPIIDMLIDDLGSTLIRFDCYGKADWLDPAKQNPDKTFPDEYLEEAYTSKVFTDTWETFRYFDEKGIEPILNINGRIPPEWAGEDLNTIFPESMKSG